MSDLHGRLLAAVNERLELARAATPGPWTVEDAYARVAGCRCLSCYEDEPYGRMIPELDGPPRADTSPVLYDHDASFIAANDPATVIRHGERDLKVLERHHAVARDGSPVWASFDGTAWCWCCTGMDAGRPMVGGAWPCDEIRDLAEAYGIEVQP